jgi:hypothetical protein
MKKIDCEGYEQLHSTCAEQFQKFYLQMSLQPIQFTTAGFYTINLTLLASVKDK